MTEILYTREDYMQLPEGCPVELVDGCLIKEPSPTWWHQRLLGAIHVGLERLVGVNRVIEAPADVSIDEYNVLQPDILVLAEEDRIRPGGTQNAIPILVVEVLSPSSAERDRAQKAETYLRAGVREVWVVDPDEETIGILTTLGSEVFEGTDSASSNAVPGFHLVPDELFKVD